MFYEKDEMRERERERVTWNSKNHRIRKSDILLLAPRIVPNNGLRFISSSPLYKVEISVITKVFVCLGVFLSHSRIFHT